MDSKHTYYNGHCYEMVTVGKHYFAHDDEAKLLYGPEAHIVAISDAAEMRLDMYIQAFSKGQSHICRS